MVLTYKCRCNAQCLLCSPTSVGIIRGLYCALTSPIMNYVHVYRYNSQFLLLTTCVGMMQSLCGSHLHVLV